jgi:hypothetical protein
MVDFESNEAGVPFKTYLLLDTIFFQSNMEEIAVMLGIFIGMLGAECGMRTKYCLYSIRGLRSTDVDVNVHIFGLCSRSIEEAFSSPDG